MPTAPHLSGAQNRLVAVAQNAGMGIGAQAFFLMLRFVTAVVITRTIGPKHYGTYVLAMSIIAVVEVIGLLGLEPAMIRFVAHYKALADIQRVKSVLRIGLMATLIPTVFISAWLYMFSPLAALHIFHNPDLTPVLRVMLLGAAPTSMMLVILAALQGARLVKYKIAVQYLFSPFFRLIAVLAALGFGFSLIGVAWVWTLTAIAGFCLSLAFVSKHIGLLQRPQNAVRSLDVLFFSLPLMLSRVFSQNISIVGILLIGMFFKASDVGVYGVAMRTIPFLLVPLIAFNAILSPIFSELFTKGNMEELKSVYKVGNKWVISITLPICVLMIHYADVIASIFGAGFELSAQVMSIILVGQMVNAASGSSALMLSMTGRPMFMLLNSAVVFILNIGLTLFLLVHIGITGAAYAYSIAVITIQCLQLIEVWYLYKFHPYCLENIKAIIACAVSFAVLSYTMGLELPDSKNFHPMLSMLIFGSCYILCLLLAGFSKEDRMIYYWFKSRFATVPPSGGNRLKE